MILYFCIGNSFFAYMIGKQYKIVYCTPALYMAGGVERVLTLKANYFADHFGYDIPIILTDGKDKPTYYFCDFFICCLRLFGIVI